MKLADLDSPHITNNKPKLKTEQSKNKSKPAQKPKKKKD